MIEAGRKKPDPANHRGTIPCRGSPEKRRDKTLVPKPEAKAGAPHRVKKHESNFVYRKHCGAGLTQRDLPPDPTSALAGDPVNSNALRSATAKGNLGDAVRKLPFALVGTISITAWHGTGGGFDEDDSIFHESRGREGGEGEREWGGVATSFSPPPDVQERGTLQRRLCRRRPRILASE